MAQGGMKVTRWAGSSALSHSTIVTTEAEHVRSVTTAREDALAEISRNTIWIVPDVNGLLPVEPAVPSAPLKPTDH